MVVISPRPDLNKLLHEFIYRIWTTMQFRNGYFSFYKNSFRWLWWKGSWNAIKITSSWLTFEIYVTKLFQVIAIFHIENNPMVLNEMKHWVHMGQVPFNWTKCARALFWCLFWKFSTSLYTKSLAGKIQIFAFHIFTNIYYAVFCQKSLEFNLDIVRNRSAI